ncbi:MAG: hypothetical protein AB1778_07990 [Candidatus Bipolaricaulota bacterium]
MKRSTRAWGVGAAVALAAVAVALLWPPEDPLAGARTVAIRTGTSEGGIIDLERELRVELSDRDLLLVTDEEEADVVLYITDVRLDFGDVELTLEGGRLGGRLSAVCRVEDVRTGRSYVMDFHLRIQDGDVQADLAGRRFWEFWKPSPSEV